MSNDSELCVILESDCQKVFDTLLYCSNSLELLSEACSTGVDVTLFYGPLQLFSQILSDACDIVDPSELNRTEREFSFTQRALLLKEIEELKDNNKRSKEECAEYFRELRVIEKERDSLRFQLGMAARGITQG